jgi:site-specific recombinase XerC
MSWPIISWRSPVPGGTALLTEDLRRIVRKLRVEKPGGCRDRAVLLVGFGAALRRSELIALNLDDIAITQAGLTILVRRSKTAKIGANGT